MSNSHTTDFQWIVVTGATGGIGQAIAERSLQDGYGVLAIGRNKEKIDQWADSVTSNKPDILLEVLAADLTSVDLESKLEDKMKLIQTGRIDSRTERLTLIQGLVNAAGISLGDDIENISLEDWSKSLDINVTAAMRTSKFFLPYLKSSPSPSIVNVSSQVAKFGCNKVSYAASKAALIGFNHALARNLGRYGIRVNAILPGPTITNMTSDWSQNKRQQIAEKSLLKRLCEPRDVAGAVSFLLGPDSCYITGSVLDVSGGQSLTGL